MYICINYVLVGKRGGEMGCGVCVACFSFSFYIKIEGEGRES